MVSWWFDHEPGNDDLQDEKPPTKKRKRERLPASTIETRLGTIRRLSGVKNEVGLRQIAIRLPPYEMSSLDHSYWWYTGRGGQGIQTFFLAELLNFRGTMKAWIMHTGIWRASKLSESNTCAAMLYLVSILSFVVSPLPQVKVPDAKAAAEILEAFDVEVVNKTLPLCDPTTLFSPSESFLQDMALRCVAAAIWFIPGPLLMAGTPGTGHSFTDPIVYISHTGYLARLEWKISTEIRG